MHDASEVLSALYENLTEVAKANAQPHLLDRIFGLDVQVCCCVQNPVAYAMTFVSSDAMMHALHVSSMSVLVRNNSSYLCLAAPLSWQHAYSLRTVHCVQSLCSFLDCVYTATASLFEAPTCNNIALLARAPWIGRPESTHVLCDYR